MMGFTTIVDCFEAQVERYRDRIAVKTKKNNITYDGLNKLANLIAYQILSSCPVKSETDVDTIAMVFEHDADMIVGIMGILKAGKAYVALDPTYPVGRLSYILEDSKAKFIITNDTNLSLAKELSGRADYLILIININSIDVNGEDRNLNIKITPEQAAYILYTSGSTGKPKGVVQSHKNVLHFMHCFINELHISYSDRMALLTSYSHSIAAIDIFSVLLCGASLYPYNIKSDGNMGKFANWIREEEITIFNSVPTIYRYFTETITSREQVSSIRAVAVGGEAVYTNDLNLYKRFFQDTCIFVNLFGCTELILTMINIITKEKAIKSTSVSLGHYVKGVDVSLLDEYGEAAGLNSIGEFVYRSRYLTPGYWNKEGYIQDIFSKSTTDIEERIYKSGDLGKILPDGSIEYIGRKDFQVKINGNRVECGEIEDKLLNHSSVREAAVIAKQNPGGNNYLCAFLVMDSELSPAGLRQYLEKEVPNYMVPAYFIQLEKMPLTENGKLDRKELQKMDIDISIIKEDEPPADEIEEMMVELWKKILDRDQVGVNNSFFDMGGNSILAIKFEVEMEKRGIKLTSNDVYQLKTIRKLTLSIKDNKEVPISSENSDANGKDIVLDSEKLRKEGIQPISQMEGDVVGKHVKRKILNNIMPFNDIYYRTCYMNALIPAVKHLNKSILPFLVNEIVSYSYNNVEEQKIIEYIPIKPINDILDEIDIKLVTKSENCDLIEDIRSAISAGRPVILWIDCFYSPVRPDMYQKQHWGHCMVVYGYDDDQQICNIIEHKSRDNLSYEEQVMKYQDILCCCKGYKDNFYKKDIDMPAFMELYPKLEGFYVTQEERLQSYIHRFVTNMYDKKEDLFARIETITNYRMDFENITCNRELLDKNIESMLAALNQVNNIKQVERYRLKKLFGDHLKLADLLDKINGKWEYIRKVIAKYMYSSVYKKEIFYSAAENIGQIYELEIRFNKELFNLLDYWKI